MALPAGLSYDSPNVNITGPNPTPGPKQPGKYPVPPGPAYQHYGEQQGYVYDPYSDKYYPDPTKYHEYQQQIGAETKPPATPGLTETLLPVAALGVTSAVAKGAGQGISKQVGDWWSGTPATTGGGTTSGAGVATPGAGTTPSKGSGFFGLGDYFKGGSSAASAANTAADVAAPAAGAGAAGLAASTNPAIQAGTATIGAYGATPIVGEAAAGAGAGASSAAGLSAAGTAAAGLGAIGGAYGLYNTATTHQKAPMSIGSGAASGAALGASIGSVVPVLGTGVGAAIGAIGGALIGLFSSSSFQTQGGWKKERKKLDKLAESGTYIPPGLVESMPTKRRKLEELIRKDVPADFVGRDANGAWVNNQFAKTRDVKDLRGEDIVNYSAFAEQDPSWFTRPLEERLVIANDRLAAGAVKEHHGTIDVDFQKGGPGPAPAQGAPASPGIVNAPGGSVPGSNVNIIPAKGTRISPGVYADGRGGAIKRAA